MNLKMNGNQENMIQVVQLFFDKKFVKEIKVLCEEQKEIKQ